MKKSLTVLCLALAFVASGCQNETLTTLQANIALWNEVRHLDFIAPQARDDASDEHGLHYGQLSEEEKGYYDAFLEAFRQHTDTLALKGKGEDLEVLDRFYRMVWDDHPEFLDVPYQRRDGYDATLYRFALPPKESLVVKLRYQAVEPGIEAVRAKEKDFIEATKKLDSDREKAWACYNHVAQQVYYDPTATDQSLRTAALNGRGVCAGYARFYQFLLQEVGVDAGYVRVKINEPRPGELEDHALVIMQLKEDPGHYYASDPTWGDQLSYQDLGLRVDPTYFAMDQKTFDAFYTYIEPAQGLRYSGALPDMTSNKLDEFEYRKLYASTPEELQNLLPKHFEEGPFVVRLDGKLYETLQQSQNQTLPAGARYFLVAERKQLVVIPQ